MRSIEYVAGFTSHGFRQMSAGPDEYHIRQHADLPRPASNSQPSRCKVTQLKLVSLMLHDEPRVNESDELPRMQQLEDYAT